MRIRLLTIILFATMKSFGQIETERQFVERILDALKTEDFQKVKELLPTKATWDTFANLTGKPLPDNFDKDYLNERKVEFNRLFELGKKNDVDWKRFKVDKFEAERKNLQGSTAISLTGHLILKHRKRIVTLYEVSIMELDSVYYLMGIRNLINGQLYTGKD